MGKVMDLLNDNALAIKEKSDDGETVFVMASDGENISFHVHGNADLLTDMFVHTILRGGVRVATAVRKAIEIVEREYNNSINNPNVN